ncbi:MAG: type II toxin-antitoxin system VapC family toxin [Thermoanaerobaculia bacterium]
MILLDVNVLVDAFREDAEGHAAVRRWLDEAVNSEVPYGLTDLVLAGFLRIVTHPRIFTPPTPVEEAQRFAEALRSQPNCLLVTPGPRHWEVFSRLCREIGARGNLVPDAYHAALAIESGCEWITLDRDYSRFPGLKWTTPT